MRNLLLTISCLIALATYAQTPKVSSGKVIHLPAFKSKYIRERNVDVWLPKGYNKRKKYFVIYMHDGQALFDSTLMWNHQEWKVDETLGSIIAKHQVKDCIVVGIWNTPDRFAEYFPQKPYETLAQPVKDSLAKVMKTPANSDNYLLFIVKELKPYIDSAYSTYQDRKHTFIAGSSMGGLISMYAICEYPDVFGGAACISTHWTGLFKANEEIPLAFNNYMQAHLPTPATHKFYFDHGDQTLDALYEPYQLMIDNTMKQKGYSVKNWLSKQFPRADHSENSWNKRLNIPLLFLLK